MRCNYDRWAYRESKVEGQNHSSMGNRQIMMKGPIYFDFDV